MWCLRTLSTTLNFNPRLREGGDGIPPDLSRLKLISIHASAKEATFFELKTGNDSTKFQSTPPQRRRRRYNYIIFRRHYNFNPRLREGGDFEHYFQTFSKMISIHASAKEATRNGCRVFFDNRDFNPRLREGGDTIRRAERCIIIDFNPRLREGGDQGQLLLIPIVQ